MKLDDFDWAHFAAAWLLRADRSEPWREAIAALKFGFARAWAGLYAAPPRHLPPMV